MVTMWACDGHRSHSSDAPGLGKDPWRLRPQEGRDGAQAPLEDPLASQLSAPTAGRMAKWERPHPAIDRCPC